MAERIDIERWNRRDHFALFRNAVQPFFSVTVEVDVTGLWRHCRQSQTSYFLAALYLALRAIDATDALKLRMRGDEVWRHDRVGIGTTILRSDETFGFARFDLMPAFDEFRRAGENAIARVQQNLPLDPMPGQDDLVYHSSLPWLRFTAFTNALALKDSIPRLMFGKCHDDGHAVRMPVAIEVHHALVDGLDVARFFERFERDLAGFAAILA